MNKKILLLCASIISIGVFYFVGIQKNSYLTGYLDPYAHNHATEQFGSKSLEPHHEQFVLSIAHELGITEPIVMRKMNYKALQTFGYHNAFVYFSALFEVIPLSDQPFLFISQSFFEDLSPHEQRFLIGHELIHIQKRHTQWLNFVSFVVIFLLTCTCMWGQYHITQLLMRCGVRHYLHIAAVGFSCVFLGLFLTSHVTKLAYRRYIERQADHLSITALHSHDGALELCNRWQKDFKMPEHEKYGGLLTDHPSIAERKQYCMNYKNQSKQ